MKNFGIFMLGVLTTLVVMLGVFVYNTVGVYTQTTYVYNPSAITNMFGTYSETTK